MPLKCLTLFLTFALTATTLGQAPDYDVDISVFCSDRWTLLTNNMGFENGTDGWTSLTADFAGISQIEQRNWSPGARYGQDNNMADKFMRISGQGDVGQFVELSNRTPTQILRCLAFCERNDGGWCGFGITYYDAAFNELETFRKEIVPAFGSTNLGYGDGMVPHSIGLVVPEGAAFAYIWAWNGSDSSELFLDRFGLFDYFNEEIGSAFQIFPNADKSLILNGDFDVYPGNNDEFWQISEVYDTVFPYSRYGVVETGNRSAMRIGGQLNPNLIYQYTGGMLPNQEYDFSAWYRRLRQNGSVSGDDAATWAIAGINMFDANWNKIDSVSMPLQTIVGLDDDPARNTQFFTAPGNVAHAFVWVWTEALGNSTPTPLSLDRIDLRKRDITPPIVEFEGLYFTGPRGTYWGEFQDGEFGIRAADFEDVCFTDIDFGDRDQNFIVTGVENDFETTVSYRGRFNVGRGQATTYVYKMDTYPTEPGRYNIRLQANQIRNRTGLTTRPRALRTFRIAD